MCYVCAHAHMSVGARFWRFIIANGLGSDRHLNEQLRWRDELITAHKNFVHIKKMSYD